MPSEGNDPPCLAARHHGAPVIKGPHAPHAFTYGPNGMYHGHCGGRGEPEDWPMTPEQVADD